MKDTDPIFEEYERLRAKAAAEKVNFLAKYARFQSLKAKNEELNLKTPLPRSWGSKRKLAPKGSKTACKAGPGAPIGNRNRWKHGNYSGERRAFFAAVSAFIKASDDLLDELNTQASKGRPRSATPRSV